MGLLSFGGLGASCYTARIMQIGPWFIPNYTLRLLAGLSLGVVWLWIAAHRRGIRSEQVATLLWAAALGALLGGRIGYVARYAVYFAQQPRDALLLWRVGGLDGPGAWVGGLTLTALWAWRARCPLRHTAALLMPAALWLSAGAWWGCFDVGCAWGREVTGTVPAWQRWLVLEAPDLYRAMAPRYAVQLLAAGSGAMLAVLAALRLDHSLVIGALYLAGMAALTALRADPVPRLGDLRLDAALYGILALLFVALYGSGRWRQKDEHDCENTQNAEGDCGSKMWR